MRILVIEDDSTVSQYIFSGLQSSGHDVTIANEGLKGLSVANKETFDAMVVDRMLPGMDGLTLIETIRKAGNSTPVLILSALSDVDDKVQGLKAGGDDYLTKPFSFTELLVRVQALIRRNSLNAEPTTLQYADLEMNLLTREVLRSKHPLQLQPREFSLLEYFLRYPGRVLSKTFILEHVWDYDFDPQTNVVDVLVSRLRSKVDRDFETKLIHTLRGVGYVLKL